MRRETSLSIASAIAFQLAWLACVLGAARGLPWLGPIVTAPLAVVFVAMTPPRGGAGLLLLAAGLLGLVIDGSLVAGGVMAFTEPAGGPALATAWMIALWVAFATTLPWSMAFLRGRLLLAATLGAILGPLAYAAGARLGAVTMGAPTWLSCGAIALGWAIALPALVLLSGWLIHGSRSGRSSGPARPAAGS